MLRKFQLNSRVPQILNNIEIFENIEQNQNFKIFVAKSAFFEKNVNKIEIIRQLWQKSKFSRNFDQNYVWKKKLTKSKIFDKF